jgi:sulfur relay (sulfurtransferase) complex TusBCD TusD component (DsrE family)
VQEVVICDRTTLRRGFVDQDQLEQFSVKQEHNQHT